MRCEANVGIRLLKIETFVVQLVMNQDRIDVQQERSTSLMYSYERSTTWLTR